MNENNFLYIILILNSFSDFFSSYILVTFLRRNMVFLFHLLLVIDT